MKNRISINEQVLKLNDVGIQTWLLPNGGVKLTQRIQLGESYAVMSLFNRKAATTADIMYKSDLLSVIKDSNWVEVKDAVICRESDLKEEKSSDDESNN